MADGVRDDINKAFQDEFSKDGRFGPGSKNKVWPYTEQGRASSKLTRAQAEEKAYYNYIRIFPEGSEGTRPWWLLGAEVPEMSKKQKLYKNAHRHGRPKIRNK